MRDSPSRRRNFGVGQCRCSGDDIEGRYRQSGHVGNIEPGDVIVSAISEGVRGYALDPNTAEALWRKSEDLVADSFE